MFLNQVCVAFSHTRLVSWNRICLCVGMCVCLCVSTLKALITSGMIWCDIGRVWLVKSIVQVFNLLPSINWMGVALVIQCVMHARQRCWRWRHTIHRKRRINYLAVATRWSALFIKVNGQMHSDRFKRLGFSFTVIVLA